MDNYKGIISEYGCIAEHLGHSFSGEIHRLIGVALAEEKRAEPYHYVLQELSPEQVEPFFRLRKFRGINVTIPYKRTVIPYLDELTDVAREIGAVNTVINRNGRLIGDNTDYFGMKYLCSLAGIELKDKKVLILGTGGTSNTAFAVAKYAGAKKIYKVSRNVQDGYLTYDDLHLHLDAQVIINTTPVGMYPNDENSPLPASAPLSDFKALCGVVDAIYHPLRTELISGAQALHIPATGGLPMLVAQAVAATERFLDCVISPDVIAEVTSAIQAQKQNIVLIGMPACGKTTVGKLLSASLGRELVDTDEEFTAMTGKRPAEYIKTYGECAFRDAEVAVIKKRIAPLSGVIIATGGGAVLRDENVRRLKRNGKLYFLDRNLESLETTPDRPLSCDRELLHRCYEERYPRYCAVSDIHLKIQNGEFPKMTASRILNEVRSQRMLI